MSGGPPAGLAVNAASVVALSLGQRFPELFGPDVKDADGGLHAGITAVPVPVPVLAAPPEVLAALREEASGDGGIDVVGFSDVAQSSRAYEEYTARLGALPAADIGYAAVGLCGPRKRVNRLTSCLPLLR